MSRQTAIVTGARAGLRARGGHFRLSYALLAWLAACIALACSGRASDVPDDSLGTLSMQLSTEVNGVTYRLSGALFDLAGPETAIFDSDDDPELTVISATLARGDYRMLLRQGWQLLRQSSPDAVFEPVEATLVSENPRAFTIEEGETTRVAYVFETNGAVIDLGKGFLEVAVEVVETGAGGSGGSGGSGGTGGIGGSGGSGGSGGGPADRAQIATEVCERLGEVPACDLQADCIEGILGDMVGFDSILACPPLVDAFFGCIGGASQESFECLDNTPSFIIGSPECSEQENALFATIGSGCP
jgi:hypothetical protein